MNVRNEFVRLQQWLLQYASACACVCEKVYRSRSCHHLKSIRVSLTISFYYYLCIGSMAHEAIEPSTYSFTLFRSHHNWCILKIAQYEIARVNVSSVRALKWIILGNILVFCYIESA